MERTKLKSKKFFTKGSTRPPNSGRKPGSANKVTRLVREAIILAAEQVGQDGRGKGALVGYLQRIAAKHPDLFVPLLARILPMQVTGADDGPVKVTTSYTLPELEQRLKERGLPVTAFYDPPIDPKTLPKQPASETRH